MIRGVAKSVLSANPLRKLRNKSNLTQDQLAELTGISVKSIYLAECGVYERPLEGLAHHFCRERGIDINQLNNDYYRFRTIARHRQRERIDETQWRFSIDSKDVEFFRTTFGTRLAPIKDFYVNCLVYTQFEFCTGFLVNPGELHRLEVGMKSDCSSI